MPTSIRRNLLTVLFFCLMQQLNAINPSQAAIIDTIRPKYTMGDFIGTNSFIDGPLDKLSTVGWIREYHPWSFNEIENNVFEYNRWNGFWDFDKFYTDLKAANIMVCPVLWSSPSWLQPNGNDRPVVGNEDPLIPNSYREIAEVMYQFAGRYGSVEVDKSTLMVNTGQTKKSGLNLISYIEDWNEQDKDWEGEKAQFKPGHYAAMASANIDGHGGTMGPNYGIKQADPNIKFVMGGLVNLDTKYLKDMKAWFVNHRPDSAWPIDVINIHHYSFVRNQAGISPEKDFFKERMENVVKWRNLNAPQSEVWLTEFGYDSNPYSMNQAPAIGTFSQEEVQAMWNLRTFLIVSSTGVDRAAHYMIRDVDPGGTEVRYVDSGLLTSKEEGHVPKVSWYYLHTMYSLLEHMYFKEVILQDPKVWVFKYENISGDSAVYACWSPTSAGDSTTYKFKTDIPTDTIKVVSLLDKSIKGTQKIYAYDSLGIDLQITESPIFVQIVKDTLSVNDTTNIDTTGIFSFRQNASFAIELFPNPVRTELNIRIERLDDQWHDLSLNLYRIDGTRIFRHVEFIKKGELNTRISTGDLSEGMYLLTLNGQNLCLSRSFIIAR